MTFTEDKEHIYNRIEAEQTEKMEAIKQIADWKMKRESKAVDSILLLS